MYCCVNTTLIYKAICSCYFFSFAQKNLFLVTLVLRFSNYNLGNWFNIPIQEPNYSNKKKDALHCACRNVYKYIPLFLDLHESSLWEYIGWFLLPYHTITLGTLSPTASSFSSKSSGCSLHMRKASVHITFTVLTYTITLVQRLV